MYGCLYIGTHYTQTPYTGLLTLLTVVILLTVITGGRKKAVMIRLTESEQERLKAQAGREPLASYCRRELLGDYREPEEQPAGKYLDGSARLDS
jgi:hypothetical protein